MAENGPLRKPRMYDVAELAGVSHQTVSRVLNNRSGIREDTRARVLAAIAEIGYTPNSIARALATNRTRRLGVIVDNPSHYGPNAALRGFEEAARVEGYAVDAISIADSADDSPATGVERLLVQGIDALCVIAPRIPSLECGQGLAGDLPVLLVTAGTVPERLTAAVDQWAGARLAVEHLLSLGHREIRHLAGPEDWLDAQARRGAWEECMATAGLNYREPVVGDWTADFGYHYAAQAPELVGATAVFAANDQMALGLLHGLYARGVRVPEDISVVGFDDIPESKHFLPPLTTVRQDFHAVGALSVTLLIAALEDKTVPHADLIAPTLVVRKSTAPPRSRS